MISIVCPFYNEKENVVEMHDRLLKMASGLKDTWEIVFVNDGSKDGGAELLESTIKNSSIRLIHLNGNFGLTTALYAGLMSARGEVMATLDADLQNPPEEIPRLLDLMPGYDMVTGIRRKRMDDWLRRISSKIANGIRRSVMKEDIQDIGCSLRVFRRSVLESFLPYKGMHRFFPGIAQIKGFKITQVLVDHEPRLRGTAKYGLGNRIFSALWDLIAIRWMLNKKIEYKILREYHG